MEKWRGRPGKSTVYTASNQTLDSRKAWSKATTRLAGYVMEKIQSPNHGRFTDKICTRKAGLETHLQLATKLHWGEKGPLQLSVYIWLYWTLMVCSTDALRLPFHFLQELAYSGDYKSISSHTILLRQHSETYVLKAHLETCSSMLHLS